MESTMKCRRERQRLQRILMAMATLGVALGAPRESAAQSGALHQLPQPTACTRDNGDGVQCTDGVGMEGIYEAAISADGKSVYAAAFQSEAVAVFSRHPTTGVLTQLAAPNGCLSESGDGVTCTQAAAVGGTGAVVVSPDDAHVYVGGLDGIAVFARNRSTGQLTQLAGTDGCLLRFGGGATGCADIAGPIGPSGLTFSPDGTHLYASDLNNDTIGVFARDRVSGALTQLPAPAGCIAENGDGVTCEDAVGIDGANAIALSRNGKQLYVASSDGDSVALFNRDRETGALTQFAAPDGCIAENGDGVTCTDAVGLNGAGSIAISRTGRQVYVASSTGSTLAIFARNAATGALTQLPAPTGCVAAFGDGVTCTNANGMIGPSSIALTNNGRHAYVSALNSGSVAVFARDKKTGALTQLAAPHGCVSNTGDGISCTQGLALGGAIGLAMPKSAKHVYVVSFSGDSIAAFERQK